MSWKEKFGIKPEDNKENQEVSENNEHSEVIENEETRALEDKINKLSYALADKENQIRILRQDIINEKDAYAIKFVKAISHDLDDLLRIMDAIVKNKQEQSNKDVEALGINLKKLLKSLESMNIKVTKPNPGDDFDSNMHNVISQTKSEEFENGKILQSLSACYMVGDKVVSPAMVVIVNND